MRGLIIALALFCAVAASGQIYIDSYRFGGANLLLDQYSGAAAAYSLRKLNTSYTGDCITIRRASNNDTLAIGFLDNYLDTAALKTFCSGTTCSVRRWFDQSGNNRDAIMTTDANQPNIFASGSITYEEGQPTILFDGTNDALRTTTYSFGATDYSVMIVSRSGGLNVGGRGIFSIMPSVSGRNGFFHLLYRNNLTNNLRAFYSSDGDVLNFLIQSPTATFPTVQNLISNFVPQSGSIVFSLNGTQQDSDSAIGQTLDNVQFYVGNYYDPSQYFHQGSISEVIIYMSDQTTNKSGIETNINNFYTIY